MHLTETSIDGIDKTTRISLYFQVWIKGVAVCILGVITSYIIQILFAFAAGQLVNEIVTTSDGFLATKQITFVVASILIFVVGVVLMLPLYVRWILDTSVNGVRISLVMPVTSEWTDSVSPQNFEQCNTCGVLFIPGSMDRRQIKVLKETEKWLIGRFDHGSVKGDWDAVLVADDFSHCPRCSQARVR